MLMPIKMIPVYMTPDGRYPTVFRKFCCGVGHIVATAALFMLAACSGPEVILDGERAAIIKQQDTIRVDEGARSEGAGLPAPLDVVQASHPGLNAGHAGGNITIALPFQKRWVGRIGGWQRYDRSRNASCCE